MGRPRGSAACSATSNGVPSSTLPITSPRNLVSSRLTTKAGESLTSTQFLFSALPTASAVATAASSVWAAWTTSTSGSTATGLKKWKPTTRSGCARRADISVTDSEEVLVASTQSGRTTASTSAKTCCLTAISSNTASITKSASANASLVSDPLTRPVSLAAASSLSRPRRASLAISACTWSTPASRLACSRSVSTTGTSKPAGEQQRDLRGHQARTDHADLGHRPGQRLIRRARGLLGPLLGEVERVQASVQLVAEQQVREPLVLGGEPVVPAAVARGGDQVDGPVGRGGGAVQLAVREEPRRRDRGVPVPGGDLRGHGGPGSPPVSRGGLDRRS